MQILKQNIFHPNILLSLTFAAMMAALALVFVYVPTEKTMGVVQRIFYFHVPLAWVCFLAYAVVFVCSLLYLRQRDTRWDRLAHSSAEIGIVFTTLVLIAGTIWAKAASKTVRTKALGTPSQDFWARSMNRRGS
jgi:heme exporter protein C